MHRAGQIAFLVIVCVVSPSAQAATQTAPSRQTLQPDAQQPAVQMAITLGDLHVGGDDVVACELLGPLELSVGTSKATLDEQCEPLCSNESDVPDTTEVCGVDSEQWTYVSAAPAGSRTYALLRNRYLSTRIFAGHPERNTTRERFEYALYGWVCGRIDAVLRLPLVKDRKSPKVSAIEGWQRIRVNGKLYRWDERNCRYTAE
jgi:hypothetical protein